MRTVTARAPTRIDFGGGWTDVPPFCDERGGRVCNLAIDRYATVTLMAAPTAASDVRAAADSPLAQAATRRIGVRGVRSTLRSDFPTGAGLGGSSAVGVAMVAALRAWQGQSTTDLLGIVNDSRAVEIEDLGIAGGWQDHYAAAFGGALDLTFGPHASTQRIPLTASTRRAIEAQCLVVYTGQSRISGDTITAVLDAYARQDSAVTSALLRMQALAADMAHALAAGDLDALGDAVHEHWVHQRALHPAITTAQIDAIVDAAARQGARGCKALGASGGGCVVVIAPPGRADAIREAITPLGRLLNFAVDLDGVTVTEQPT
jgi:D-glycero-alpha-D-manno-heptose-7-phosphate kinase